MGGWEDGLLAPQRLSEVPGDKCMALIDAKGWQVDTESGSVQKRISARCATNGSAIEANGSKRLAPVSDSTRNPSLTSQRPIETPTSRHVLANGQ